MKWAVETLIASALVAAVLVAVPTAARAAGDEGLVPADEWTALQDAYLEFATERPLNTSSPLSLIAYAERGRRDPGFDASAVAGVGPDDFADIFDKLRAFEDTGDFDVNRLLYLLLRYRDALAPELADAIEERILAFKYWWTEPTPEGIVDSQYYWTENHLIIFLANEYVAGQAYPDTVFTNSGMTGTEHMAHAEPRLRRWLDERARFGFSEWLSNVYWMEDLKGLLLLAEFADDADLARRASMMLDVLFVELASHLQNGSFGSTHGRSYMKDKLTAFDDDTYNLAKMVFDDTEHDHTSVDTATLLAAAERYRPPEVARRIAGTDEVGTVRQHQSLPIDPSAPITPDPEPPYGKTYEGEEGLMTWWSMGAQFPWQMAVTSAETVEQYNLWESSNFQQAAALEPIVDLATPSMLRSIARLLAVAMNPGLLSEVDTSTWRSPEVMLSAAQDWRPGERSEQGHPWQATLDAEALVFTNHPRDPVPPADDPNSLEGYWTGEATLPRVAHHEQSLIAIYAPQYPSLSILGSGAYSFEYENYTHAFFPTERFDEVVERNGWVIGRLGDGYAAIRSWRPARWREYDPDTEHTRGLTERFDLVARGGANNVWITEVARADDFGGAADPFAAFVETISSVEPDVRPYFGAAPCPRIFAKPWGPCATLPFFGFTVRYESPTSGPVRFGYTPHGPNQDFVVDGEEIDLHPELRRWDSPWAEAGWNTAGYHAAVDGWTLDVDFGAGTRITAAPDD